VAKISSKELPRHVRRCYELAMKAGEKNRNAEIERLKFYAGDQWRDEEKRKREQQQRPIITINKCAPAVNQIEGDIRLNPPGPVCHPVGGGADKDTADIIEGGIREIEYRSNAQIAYATAGKYVAASGYGVIELATEYVDDRRFAQRLRIDSVEDPSCIFFDPTARRANREDACWAGKLRMYNRIDYIAAFGSNRKVLQKRGLQSAMGWIQDAMGIDGNLAEINTWTGTGEGPFYVCEFYMVEVERKKLRMYSDHIARFDDEAEEGLPRGVHPMVDVADKQRYVRDVPIRTITKYLVDALEVLDETEWPGTLIPLFPVLGPEVYIDGKLHRMSLISGAIDSSRGLNFAATTATELAGLMPKSPWIGVEGTFDDPRWKSANSEVFSYLEYKPVPQVDPATGAVTWAPPPQRNQWETPIQWLLMLAGYFSDSIKAVTAIYDPSLGQQKGDQSGKAIEQLRSESNVGNFSYSDNLHRAIATLYGEIVEIWPKITDANEAQTIIRADDQHEIVIINRTFADNGIDPTTGKKGKKNDIRLGQYSVRVTVGKADDTRDKEALTELRETLAIAPQSLAVPGVLAQVVRLIADGNPKMEAIADLMSPPIDGDVTPQQMGQQLQVAQQKNQQLMQVVQQLHQAIQSKLPELEAKKMMNALDNLTRIHVAEVTASKDADNQAAERESDFLQSMLGMAHEAATQAADHEHQAGLAQQQQEAAAQAQAADHQHATESQESDQEAAAQQQEANQGAENG
jgi:Phage P22-like portal protein